MRRALSLCLFFWLLTTAHAQTAHAQNAATLPVTNANAVEQRAIEALLARLDRAVAAHDLTALRLFGVADTEARAFKQYPALAAQRRITQLATTAGGALVRQVYRISGTSGTARTPVTLRSGTHELWLQRLSTGEFIFSSQRWAPPADAVAALTEAAREEADALAAEREAAAATAAANPRNPAPGVVVETAKRADESGDLLHLVAERRGGRWIALRRSRWSGRLLGPERLAQRTGGRPADVSAWLRQQMERFENVHSGTAHFFLQRGSSGWAGLDTVWNRHTLRAPESETTVNAWRRDMEGRAYLSAVAHRDFGVALVQVGLYGEAADELEKAEALQPGLISAKRLTEIAAMRARDPQALAVSQLQNEAKVGLDTYHPVYVINELVREQKSKPTLLYSLRLGLEFSKLADDEQAGAWLKQAEDLARQGALAKASESDVAWAKVLEEHLREREQLRTIKPPNVVRSALFTVRCYPNDLSTLPVLAALEAAQHTVYSDFGIPMGSTEVVVWRSQSDFQRYTARFSEHGNSEFVAALTLTKLIATQAGPMVLGEEVNVFTDPRANIFSTVAHEYGHVAVRQLSRGRMVPVWFNEGIASAVEGGYEGYQLRVRKAAVARTLLSMAEMQTWGVDGERAFLAYSQANSLIDYIVAQWGREAVLEILRQIGRDVPPNEAMRSVLKVTPQELWNRWARGGIR